MDLTLTLKSNPLHKAAVLELARAGGSMTIADFDRVNEPHGALLRRDLAPSYVRESGDRIFLTPAGRAKSADLAGQTIDHLTDHAATPEDRADRKRRLLKGPKEFRDMRGDGPKSSRRKS